MEHIGIAALRPDLDALDSKQIKAVVTLIWPYSSSQRQFALLLAEPNFRLRSNKGQVRARFSSTSARALATTGVGIGDEVVLSLHGAQFVQDGAVSTPGKSLDWELAYTQTVAISVRRSGTEIANLELIDAAPTPAPRSPVKQPAAAPSPAAHWSSPAFLKRARLSDGPFFEQPAYDPLTDENNDRHDKKRRRKSYRDWKAWTYTARTPSPEKEQVDMDDDLDHVMSSPSRPPQLPKTPVSPTRTDPSSNLARPGDNSIFIEETTIADSAEGDTTVDDGELQKVHVPPSTSPARSNEKLDHENQYGQPNEESALDSLYDFGGDTELNTDDEREDISNVREDDESTTEPVIEMEGDTIPDIENDGGSTTELATELEDEHEHTDDESEVVVSELSTEAVQIEGDVSVGATEEHSLLAITKVAQTEDASMEEGTTIDESMPGLTDLHKVDVEPLATVMPPPSLPALNTDFAAPLATSLLTPVGKEPSSPTLKAVDSATLPLPSPFPGDQAISYMDHVSVQLDHAPLDGPAAETEEAEPGSDADYIMENSFFSSISSSKAGGLHQDHETAFTPVRFTFGMDGAGWSRPLELSSPPPADEKMAPEDDQSVHLPQDDDTQDDEHVQTTSLITPAPIEPTQARNEESQLSFIETQEEEAEDALKAMSETLAPNPDDVQPLLEASAAGTAENALTPRASAVIVLSSDVDSDGSEDEHEDADEVMVEPHEERSSEEDDASGSEDELIAEFDKEQSTGSEAESEDDEVHDHQALPVSSQVQAQIDATVRSETEVEVETPPSPEDNYPTNTQASTAVSAVVDLGSPSADESSDAENSSNEAVVQAPVVRNGESAAATPGPDVDDADYADDLQQKIPPADPLEESFATTSPDNFDDFIAMDVVQEPTIIASSSPVRPAREPASITIPDTDEEPPNLSFDDWEPQLGMDEPLPFIEDFDLPPTHTEIANSDVKMESVEDETPYLITQPEKQDVPQESTLDPTTDILIGVPETGHELGKNQFKSIPDTAPARNTRSKTKSVVSHPEEDAYVSRLSTSMRSTKSHASPDYTLRTTVSPQRMRTRTRSTVTPTREQTQTSPYSLRSQSKHLSPDKAIATSQASPVHRSPRKLVRRDTDFDIVPSQVESRDLFGSMFEPSQELGFGYSQASQGRYSDVGFVKDSEADTSHSEASMSTVHYSDHGNDDGVETNTNLKDAVKAGPEDNTPRLKPLPANVSQTQRQARSRSRSVGDKGPEVSASQPPQTPRRSLRSAHSTFSTTPSPRIARTTRSQARVSSPARETNEEPVGEVTPKADQQSVMYPVLRSESGLRSSPPARNFLDNTSPRSSPATAPPSAQHHTNQQSNLITPEDTQQAAAEPPLSFQARQPEQSLLTTPELTQSTSASASLRSFDIPLPGIQTQPIPQTHPTRTSPRRKPATTAIPSPSPAQQPPSVSQEATLAPPTIGLSTPLSYYTPLSSLLYFLNRSSAHHSSSNPDILALCTTPSTPPSRSKTGPRDHTTAFHITDLSIYPNTTRVDIFRPHAKALPVAEAGDVVLLRGMQVKSRKGVVGVRSGEESGWCVWRYGIAVWGARRGVYGEVRAREEVRGPQVERGEGEWGEVARLRAWWLASVRAEVERGAAEGREAGDMDVHGSGGAGEESVLQTKGREGRADV